MNKLAKYVSERIYNSIDVSKMIGEVYLDCLDSLKQNDPDVEKKWNWMQAEHIEYLQGLRIDKDLKPETQKLCNVFEEKVAKKHPVAMAVLESFKADHRYDNHTTMMKEILKRLNVPQGDADVVFENNANECVIHPEYKRIHYMKQMHNIGMYKNIDMGANIKNASAVPAVVAHIINLQNTTVKPIQISAIKGKRKKSFATLSFKVANKGRTLVPHCDVIITCPNNSVFARKNEELYFFSEVLSLNDSVRIIDDHTIQLNVGDLKQNRQFESQKIFIKVPSDSKEIILKWSLSSNTIIKEGELKLVNEPTFEDCFEEADDDKAGIVVVEDLIEDII